MKNPPKPDTSSLFGIAALFDDYERKTLFRKYIFFLGWIEILILVICWLYRLGDGVYDSSGPVEAGFPWRAYFLVAFLAPIAITFVLGVIVVGFNKYFGGIESGAADPNTQENETSSGEGTGRIEQLNRLVRTVQRLPFLALLLLLAVGAGISYKLDAILAVIGIVGEKSVKVVLISGAVLLAVASIFAFVLIFLNFQLRKRSMEYQYRSEVAERFGLIILEDNSVLNKDGTLLIDGKKSKEHVPLLTARTAEGESPKPGPVNLSRPVDIETT